MGYTEAAALTARGRAHHAVATMGGTVLGGAITTFGSGAFLFPCQITFFNTMAWLISMTILASLLFSMGFFVALCIILGPNNNIGNIYSCLKKQKESSIKKQVTAKMYESSNTEVELLN